MRSWGSSTRERTERDYHVSGKDAAFTWNFQMRELYQRLKELDRDRFEQLCFHLLRAKYPHAGIRRVDGKAGDEGMDSFAGRLDGAPTVWQVKSFPNGIGDSQTNQIRESLNRALKCVSPRRWILCTSVDFDSKAHRWYEKLANKHKRRVGLDLMTASEIVHDLLYFTSIRETFFHGAVIDLHDLHKALARHTGFSLADFASVTADNAEQYLREFERRDPRFSYVASFTRNRPPRAAKLQPGIIASVFDGNKQIDVFARDIEAVRLSPPQGKFHLSVSGAKKWNEFVRTGRPQHIEAKEFLGYSSDFDFLLRTGPSDQIDTKSLYIAPTPGTLPPSLPMRLTFGSGPEAIVYDFVEFRVMSHGTEEVELLGSGPLPFEFRLTIDLKHSSAKFELLENYDGVDFRELAKMSRAIQQLSQTGQFQIYSLRQNASFFRGAVDPKSVQNWTPEFAAWVNALATVSVAYGVPLRFTETWTQEDRRSLILLEGFLTGISLPISNLTFSLIKDDSMEPAWTNTISGEFAWFHAIVPEFPERLGLFGIPIPTGPVHFSVQHGKLADAAATLSRIREAALGEPVSMTIQCESEPVVKRYVPDAAIPSKCA